ncbi:hypothetical protein ACY1LM_01415 [Klebsiella pneumoniae]
MSGGRGGDRNIITRCISTAGLPKDIIAIFQHPGELSAAPVTTYSRCTKRISKPC